MLDKFEKKVIRKKIDLFTFLNKIIFNRKTLSLIIFIYYIFLRYYSCVQIHVPPYSLNFSSFSLANFATKNDKKISEEIR